MAVGMRSSENSENQTVSRLDRDGRIADNIVAALELSVPDDVGSIDVRVNDGEVTLSGAVSSLLAFRIAQKFAESTPGVIAVNNDLEIH
ncbi:MAG: BON domain-containing protein [Planctomycetes bacterium]|nr:BON domain-containing protein [Planctomycetota bacterium]